MNKYVLLKRDEITKSILDGYIEQPIGNKFLVMVTDNNEDLLINYKKFTQEELYNFDLTKDIPINNRVDNTNTQLPFASKRLDDGRKLFRRKHGVRADVAANSIESIKFAVPYDVAKIDEVEVINCEATDTVDLKVLDSINGDYTTVPNYVLNQFGFDVNLSDIYYTDTSNYDATLNLGMQLEVIYKNNGANTKNIGVNFVLHEVKEA